jgi:hypothetical protein
MVIAATFPFIGKHIPIDKTNKKHHNHWANMSHNLQPLNIGETSLIPVIINSGALTSMSPN